MVPLVGDVIAVDLPGGWSGTGRQLRPHGAEVVAGDSHDPGTLERVRDLLGARKLGFLFIDGDHTYDGVRRDWEMYAPLVAPGGLVAFHDICHHTGRAYEGLMGVEQLWREIGAEGREIVHRPLSWGGIGVLRQA